MKKLIGLSLLVGLGALLIPAKVEAAAGVRGAKTIIGTYGAGTGAVGISTGPAVLYSVILGTGAVTDYVTFFDSASANGLVAVNQTTGGFRMRVYATSATQNTQVTFDPPLQFNLGIMAAHATGVMSSVIVFEKGRAVGQGY